MRRPALFVIDMLNDCFGHAELQRLRPSLCFSINELTATARAAGCPVIWVRQEFEPDLSDAMLDMKSKNIHMFIKGTSGPLILDELDRSDADLEVVKKRYSMFSDGPGRAASTAWHGSDHPGRRQHARLHTRGGDRRLSKRHRGDDRP
jgi:nicotinamidase-related amidase